MLKRAPARGQRNAPTTRGRHFEHVDCGPIAKQHKTGSHGQAKSKARMIRMIILDTRMIRMIILDTRMIILVVYMILPHHP
jgi:hypothetical protein